MQLLQLSLSALAATQTLPTLISFIYIEPQQRHTKLLKVERLGGVARRWAVTHWPAARGPPVSCTEYGQSMDAGGNNFDSGHDDDDEDIFVVRVTGQSQQEQELATKMLQIQSKRFYLDVKQNRRGRFIKVAEIGADGRRSQIFLAMSTAAEFRDYLSSFSDFYSSLGPPNPDTVPDDGKLKSEMMLKDNRRYYLDLKENSRGRFLRVSQTITRGGPRSQVALPAQGMIEFRDALTDLLEDFGTDDGGFKGDLPEGRHLRVDNKNFYFDIGQNNRGIYMKVSEVRVLSHSMPQCRSAAVPFFCNDVLLFILNLCK
ncbi:Transcriptional activator protein Pur-alpha [Papilio xuthus]|uniref:Transcriptional activator protein Pur-alpha n=1 Tax=Papilio xuthus TaxID=66420 RepID=A0A0N1IN05_PAPXU|nr:Transcriptional activator protein Pur-alpha [Papilio xuthus]